MLRAEKATEARVVRLEAEAHVAREALATLEEERRCERAFEVARQRETHQAELGATAEAADVKSLLQQLHLQRVSAIDGAEASRAQLTVARRQIDSQRAECVTSLILTALTEAYLKYLQRAEWVTARGLYL